MTVMCGIARTENHQEALEVYTISRPLSKENKWIAEFWSDDHSGITFTPVTRWVSVLNQVWDLEKQWILNPSRKVIIY
jgi:hypothetical protein